MIKLLKIINKTLIRSSLLIFILHFFLSCNKENITPAEVQEDKYDIDKNGIPKFVNSDYIELDKIYRISKFRSSIGHDYSDDFESCRSMKHYFLPKSDIDWSSIKIFSPINGKIFKIYQEWAGTQMHIKSNEFPAFYFIIFHINISDSLKVGDMLNAGKQIGTHIGSQTMSDIAIGVNTPNGWKLISYFDVISDSIFQIYKLRGVNSRSDLIITKEERDTDTLRCSGDTFINTGTLENWVELNSP